MCKSTVLIEIKNPSENSQKKYERSIEIIEKALGYSSASGASEISPYKAVRQLVKKSKSQVERRLLELHNAIVVQWLGLVKAAQPFKLAGNIYLNPKTGKPLTKTAWATIKRELMRAFSYVYGTQDDVIVKTAMALGRVIATKPTIQAIKVTLGAAKLGAGIRILDTDPQYRAAMTFADQYAGELIVELTQRQYKKIHDTILNAQINRMGPRQLERDLFERFGEMNRDWRMIAETEIARNTNEGALITELQKPRPEGDYVYMEGISSASACSWCLENINGKVVVLLDSPSTGGGDQLQIDDKMFTVIWPGKSNIGRRKADWWVCVPAHPHGMCSFIRYTLGYEKERKLLDDAIATAIEQTQREIVPESLA